MSQIVNDLIRHGYSLNPEINVYQTSSHEDITYSDGDESENRVLDAIRSVSDIDSLSDELEVFCTDWPSTYHLSKQRGNLLRPFTSDFTNKCILEVGSGMGPITRILGESDAIVLALEGTLRRAYATRLRTRDLENVTVVAEKFDNFKTSLEFDVITLIGVLEYSNIYTNLENAHQHILNRCFEMLKAGGNLIVAIENKLGLKYFAGANEDHVGIPMFGLEDRYTSKSVRTFGKNELERLLSKSGFRGSTFYAPLPDYKLTRSVISESGFQDKAFNEVDLIRDSFGADPQLPQSLAFTPELVIASLSQNGLTLELANSFLVVANKGPHGLTKETELAWHFSTNRRRDFCVQTVFTKNELGEIEVLKAKMSSKVLAGTLVHKIPMKSKYLEGQLLRDHLELLLSTPSWRHVDLLEILNNYNKFLLGFQNHVQSSPGRYLLAESSIDLIPRNIVIRSAQDWEAFDAEWEAKSPVDLRQVLFRAVLSLHTISHFAVDEFNIAHTSKSLFELICQLLKLQTDESLIAEFLNLEVSYHRDISGYLGDAKGLSAHISIPLGRAKYQPYAVLISAHERDSAVAERDSAVAERDSALAERDSVFDSTTWKLLLPYRKVVNLVFRK